MRSTSRLFLAVLALVSTAAFVRAQDSAVPATALETLGKPVSALRAIPFADGRGSALRPIPFADGRALSAKRALTVDPSALPIEPVAPPAGGRAEPSAASPANTSSVEVNASFDPRSAAASLAIVETATNPASPNASAKTAQEKNIETDFPKKTGTGGWILLGLVAAALFTSIVRYRSRLPKRYPVTPIANLPLDPGPVPVPAPARLN